MKNKRMRKMAVPMGLIWWKERKRHPMHRYVGRVIHRERARRGWSLEDLAMAAGISKSYLCVLERGEHSPTLEVLWRLERVFGMVRGGLLRLAENAKAREG